MKVWSSGPPLVTGRRKKHLLNLSYLNACQNTKIYNPFCPECLKRDGSKPRKKVQSRNRFLLAKSNSNSPSFSAGHLRISGLGLIEDTGRGSCDMCQRFWCLNRRWIFDNLLFWKSSSHLYKGWSVFLI